MEDDISDEAAIVPGFHGCYLLMSKNPVSYGSTYIGYTVNPDRRISQHNKGRAFGGARKTSDRGPWTMTLIVHGFPTRTAALGFEWAWQNPNKSRRLRQIFRKKEKKYEWWLRVMWTMLRTGPWNRLALKVQWLSPMMSTDPPAGLCPPAHVKIRYGLIKKPNPPPVLKKHTYKEKDTYKECLCAICYDMFGSHFLKCPGSSCPKIFHALCLAKHFLKNDDEIIPISGHCPSCNVFLLWGELISTRLFKMHGFCYKYLKSHVVYHTWVGIPFFHRWQFYGSKFYLLGVFNQVFQIFLQVPPWITNVCGVASDLALNDTSILWACISTSIHSSQAILKLAFGVFKRKPLMEHLGNLDRELQETEQMATDLKMKIEFGDFFQEQSRYVRRYQFIHLMTELVTHLFFFLGVLLQDILPNEPSTWRLPIVAYLPFDVKWMPIYAPIWLWQTVAFCFMSSTMVAVDYFVLDLVVLHQAHFEYLGILLAKILESKGSTQIWKIQLRKWIDLQRSATRIVKSLRPVLSPFMGLTFAYMIVHTCIPIFIVTMLSSWNISQKIGVVFITGSGQTMFFLLAAAGDGLASAFFEIGNKLYGLNLLSRDEDGTTYHMLKNFLHRRFYFRFSVIPLRRSTFSQILRLALSYYLLLHDLQSKGNKGGHKNK